jgi:uncharacterized protein YpmS
MKISDILESTITEAQGGMSKRWLESQTTPIVFADATGMTYTMDNLVLLPNQAPALPIGELVQELEDSAGQLGFKTNDIKVINRAPAKQGAGMLIIMKNQKNKRVAFFKFFNKRTMDTLGMHWSPADFEKETGLSWQQTRMTGTGKERKEEVISRANLKPLFAVPSNTNLAISAVPAQAKAMLASELGNDLSDKMGQLLTLAIQGRKDMIPGLAPYERDIRVDFGEVASPLALIDGKLCTGNWAQVNTELLSPLGASWANATQVYYPAAGNEPLYDSQLVWPNGTKLRISNKAEGKGGAASTVSILEVITKYPERFSKQDRAMMAPGGKYYDFVEALNIIASNKSFVGPVKLAIQFKYIDEQEGDVVLSYLENKIASGTQGLTPRLIKILEVMKAKTDLPDYKVSYHLIAALARVVVNHLNQNVELTTEFFKFILSRANLIQVNQFTSRKDDAIGWNSFEVVWPPVFTGKIKFSASDFQSNKKPTSRLSFKT